MTWSRQCALQRACNRSLPVHSTNRKPGEAANIITFLCKPNYIHETGFGWARTQNERPCSSKYVSYLCSVRCYLHHLQASPRFRTWATGPRRGTATSVTRIPVQPKSSRPLPLRLHIRDTSTASRDLLIMSSTLSDDRYAVRSTTPKPFLHTAMPRNALLRSRHKCSTWQNYIKRQIVCHGKCFDRRPDKNKSTRKKLAGRISLLHPTGRR